VAPERAAPLEEPVPDAAGAPTRPREALEARPASATPRRHSSAFPYAIVGFELATALGFGLTYALSPDGLHAAGLVATALLPYGVAAAFGVLAYRGGWDPSPAYALHGATWSATSLFIVGALIDGALRGEVWRQESLAWGLAGAGLVLGALFGGLVVEEPASIPWIAAPVILVPGVLVAGLVAVTAMLIGGTNEEVARSAGVTAGLFGLAGLGVAYTFAFLRREAEPPPSRGRRAAMAYSLVPSLMPVPGGAVMQFVGTL